MRLVPTFRRGLAAGLLTAGMLAVSAPSTAIAQNRPADACAVRDRSDTVVVMVCPQDLRADQWREAAERACGIRRMCNVWIWDNAGKAPDKAPAADSDMPRSTAAAAVAVWAHDSRSLLQIRPVR